VVLGFVLTAAGGAWLWQQQREMAERIVPPPPGVDPSRFAALAGEVASLRGQIMALAARPQPAPPPPAPGAAELQPLQAGLADASARLQGLAARLDRLAQVETAGLALAAGQPLGPIAGAPPALARFATVAPPTEAALRRDFAAAAAAALRASEPGTAPASFWQKLWAHLRSLVTVAEGEKVLLGPPAAAPLAAARARLDAGDLAGAVAALQPLDPAAARVMASWRAEAQALLDARAALLAMARS
jgi:hypothetical protein